MDPEQKFDVMTPRTYAFGAFIFLLGLLGVSLMYFKPNIDPLLIIFFYSIPSNCAIVVFPHEPVIVLYGKTINIWNLTIAATLGTILAAYLDYKFFAPVLNLSYSAKFKSSAFYKKAHYWFYKLPFLTIVAAGFTPIPFFPFKFMVYASKYPIWRYLGAVTVGRFPRYFLLAFAGFYFQIPDWIIYTSFVAMILIVYHRKLYGWISRPVLLLFRRGKTESE